MLIIRLAAAWLLAALTALLPLVAVRPPAAASAGSTLIVPGQAIGPARLGATETDLAAILGPSIRAGGGQITFPRWGVAAALQLGVTIQLKTANPQFRTRRGAGVGTRIDEVSGLIGDPNQISAITGSETTIVYPFQGIGFVFRAGRAVEVFVTEPISTRAVQAPESEAARAGAAVMIQDLAETVDAATSLFRVTGRVINTGVRPLDSVTVTAVFERITGDDSWKQLAITHPVAPGTDIPFSLGTYVGIAPIGRYTITVAAQPSGRESTAEVTRTVPPSEYAELARRNIRVDVALGAPDASAKGMVQVFVSIAGTGPIPQAWVKDVVVVIPFRGGAAAIDLVPGETLTLLVPPLPITGGVVLGRPAVVGEQPLALVGSIVGTPQIIGVTLGAP